MPENLPSSHPNGVKISKLKKRDILSLLPYIQDENVKAFYQSLPTEDVQDTSGDSDCDF